MKTNTLKRNLIGFLACTICFAVVLSHLHIKDTVMLLRGNTSTTAVSSLTSMELRAKTIEDLHHHIDKTMLKNIIGDATSVARSRELQPLAAELDDETLSARLHDFLLRLRVVGSLCFHQYAYALAV